jgi:tetratricopeptide (TPR) repeat protein
VADTVSVREVSPATLLLLGTVLRELGALNKAMRVLRQAQRQYPDDWWLNDTLGLYNMYAFHPARVQDAARYYAIASALRPSSPRGHRALAWALESWARDEAMAEYTRAIELAPNDSEGWRLRGEAFRRANQHDQALADCSKAVELDPADSLAHLHLAHSLKEKGRVDQAIAEYQAAARLKPVVQGPLWSLDKIEEMNGKGLLDRYLAAFARAARLGPEDGFARAFYGMALAGKGRWEDALVEYRAAHRLVPDNPFLHTYFRDALVSTGRYDEAIDDFKKELSLRPNDPDLHTDLGRAFYAKGLFNEASAEFRKALSLSPGEDRFHLGVYLFLGEALENSGQLEEAVAAYREFHRIYKKLNHTDPHPKDLEAFLRSALPNGQV